jgi:hypothetical protein
MNPTPGNFFLRAGNFFIWNEERKGVGGRCMVAGPHGDAHRQMAEKPGIATRLGVSKCTDTLHQYTDTLHADTLHQYTGTEKPGIATRLGVSLFNYLHQYTDTITCL